MSEGAPEGHELLSGWGRTAPTGAEVRAPHSLAELAEATAVPSPRGVIARGLGRSYGDAAQNAGGVVLDTTAVADEPGAIVDGIVRLPASTSVDALLRRLVPQGWFVPVTAGTRFITIGGAVAADIHGKNHHVDGSIANHLRRIRLALPDGSEVTCSPAERADLFWATAGGMGLTGVILDVDLALSPIGSSTILVDTDRAADLDEVLALMADESAFHYSVAWIDTMATGRNLGRSVLTRGDFAPSGSHGYTARVLATAPPFPANALNRLTIRAFNEAWFRRAPRQRRQEPQSIPQFFHPLDMVGRWNRAYGRRGFLQWQPVIPLGEEHVLREIIERLARARVPTFVNVLKRFGPGNQGPLSFPLEGWTLSIDIPAGVRGLAPLLDELDVLVADVGGRIYLAKDSRLRAELLPVMYPRLEEWCSVRESVDPQHHLQSDLARRLRLCGSR